MGATEGAFDDSSEGVVVGGKEGLSSAKFIEANSLGTSEGKTVGKVDEPLVGADDEGADGW